MLNSLRAKSGEDQLTTFKLSLFMNNYFHGILRDHLFKGSHLFIPLNCLKFRTGCNGRGHRQSLLCDHLPLSPIPTSIYLFIRAAM